jgi:Lon protease-like protein
MGTVPEEQAGCLSGAPDVRSIAGLGEICRHERLPDGRFLVWLFGLSRVRVKEAPSERMYRRVEIEPLLETAPAKERESMLRDRLRKAILSRCDETTSLPKEIPTSCLADLLVQRLSLPQREMEKLYEELDVEARAERGLELHVRHPHVRPPRRGKAKE